MVQDNTGKAVQLRVTEARQRDVGKNRARFGKEIMDSLGLTTSDTIGVVGNRLTPATAWPTDDENQANGDIRIDGQTRKNAGVALNDYVTIRKGQTKTAKSVVLAPVGTKLSADNDFAQFVKGRLREIPLNEGDEISVVILGNPILFTVSRVRPKTIVRLDQATRLTIVQEPVTEMKSTPLATYEEIGGLKEEMNRLREIVDLPLRHPEVFQRLGVEPASGILLHGPPGCGKTLIARALANESEANFFPVNGPEIMNKYYGETEAKLRDIFKEARDNSPSIIFIDEIDAIAPRREEVFGDVEKRVVAQLLSLMDGLGDRGNVVVIGATNRPDGLDPALRRPGRFDREVEIGVPNHEGRLSVLEIHTRGMPLSSDIRLPELAQELYGYTGADLRALTREAALIALRRQIPNLDSEVELIPPQLLERIAVIPDDFRDARKEVIPTALREFYIETPHVGWSDVAGLEDIKKTLQENVIWAVKEPSRFRRVGVKPPRGVIMFGPSGCGKTLLAQVIASESGANFITVKGPEILSKWVGESEKAIREIFRKAKTSAPCVLFFDEIDSIAKTRSISSDDYGVGERVLSQLLAEMDSIYSIGDVFVVAATNRPDLLDISIIRPGRLDLILYISSPDEPARLAMLDLASKAMPLAANISMEEIARTTIGYSGADLEALCREAGIAALRRSERKPVVNMSDFESALAKMKPSVPTAVEDWYKEMNNKLVGRIPREATRPFYG